MIKIEKTIVEPNLDIDHLAAKMIDLALTAKFVLNPVLHLPDLADWCHKWRSEIQAAYRYYLSGDCKYLVFVEYGMNQFDYWWATEDDKSIWIIFCANTNPSWNNSITFCS